jgi:PTH1 family peptidyl-tRNA hydrolase
MKLIVGLGNPGSKYQGTRHNAGFEVLAELARRHGDGNIKEKYQAHLIEGRLGSEKIVLLSPVTYMNRSGNSVRAAFDFYKPELEDCLIICDDFNLQLGQLRIRGKGSAGGQNGLNDVIKQLGTNEVPRLRVGIGLPPPRWDVADFVLSQFSKEEKEAMSETYCRAADAVAVWSADGVAECMNQFNGSATK